MRVLPTTCWGMLVMVFTAIHTDPATATPWGWQGAGVVKVTEGRPAICIPGDAKKNFSVESVWLIHESGTDRKLVWSLEASAPSGRFVLRPGQCLPYGAALHGYIQKVPAQALTEAGRYTFRLNADAVRRTDTASYWGSFCLKPGGGLC